MKPSINNTTELKQHMSAYNYPGPELLADTKAGPVAVNDDEQKANREKITEVLADLGIGVEKITATVGPTYTLYKVVTDAKKSRLCKVEPDIAMSLDARVVLPEHGERVLGIEIPNRDVSVVTLRQVMESPEFVDNKCVLPLALGKDVYGRVVVADLCKLPHLLVAGRYYGMDDMIVSLLFKRRPEELKLLLIDSQQVYFSVYAGLENHFLAMPEGGVPVASTLKEAVTALNAALKEMEERYKLLMRAGARNIKEYNNKFLKQQLNPEEGHRFLPYIVVMVHELADLIMTCGREVEIPITRMAQLARAVGIHLIVGTRRPTPNILTGTIKANFPVRIALKVANMFDSRMILDRPGANLLMGRGDMLFLDRGKLIRLQSPLVLHEDGQRVVDYIKEQPGANPYLLPEVEETPLEGWQCGGEDPLLEEAAYLVVDSEMCFAALLQREWSIGYNRACRLMQQLEEAGIVGPREGLARRKVLAGSRAEADQLLEAYLPGGRLDKGMGEDN